MNTTASPAEPNLMVHPRGQNARRPVAASAALVATTALLLHAAASAHAIAPVPDGGIGVDAQEHVETGSANGEFSCIEAAEAEDPEPALHDVAELTGVMALEYVVSADAWDFADPPQLFGHDFHPHPDLPQWTLHAWIWTSDPYDVVPDYQPQVRLCQVSEQQARQTPGGEGETPGEDGQTGPDTLPDAVLPLEGHDVPR